LKTPPAAKTLPEAVKLLGIPAPDLVRKGEKIYKELGLALRPLAMMN
jgi:arsenate reductase-like glutaredoxin family protein